MRIFAEDWLHLSNSNKFDCIRFAQSLQKIGGLGIKLLPLQGVNAMAIRNPGCRFACPGLSAVALSGRAGLRYACPMKTAVRLGPISPITG